MLIKKILRNISPTYRVSCYNQELLEKIFVIMKKNSMETIDNQNKIDVPTRNSLNDQINEIVDCAFCGAKSYEEIYPDIAKCCMCGLVYLRSRHKETAAKRIYQNEYAREARESGYAKVATPIDQNEIDKNVSLQSLYLKYVLSFLSFPTPGLFLEIGCAWGSVLMAAKKAGYSTMGFELCLENVAFANRLDLNVSHMPFLQAKIKDDSVDCVYMCHVFEHLYQPLETIAKIKQILKPGGICYCNVPNFDCYWHDLKGSDWPWLDRRFHLFHYTSKTLSALFSKYGFTLLEVKTTTSNDFNTSPLKDYACIYPNKTAEQLLNETAQLSNDLHGECLILIAQK